MTDVLISVRPEWIQKIFDGEKTVEIRKTRPRKAPAEPAGRRKTIWLLQKRGQKNGGVVSSLPNCGYDEDELKSLQKAGYRMRMEEVAERHSPTKSVP